MRIIPSYSTLVTSFTSFKEKVHGYIPINLYLFNQITLCTINAVYLVGKCVPSLPTSVAHGAYLARSLSSLLFFGGMLEETEKSLEDMRLVIKARCWNVLPWTAVSLFVNTSSLILSMGGIFVAFGNTTSHRALAQRLFTVLAPWSQLAFTVDLLRNVLTLLPDAQVRQALVSNTFPDQTSETYLYFRSRLSAWDWEKRWKPKAHLPDERCRGIAYSLLKSISFDTQIKQGLYLAGLPAQWLTKRYPNTRLEAVIHLVMSLCYLWRMVCASKAKQRAVLRIVYVG